MTKKYDVAARQALVDDLKQAARSAAPQWPQALQDVVAVLGYPGGCIFGVFVDEKAEKVSFRVVIGEDQDKAFTVGLDVLEDPDAAKALPKYLASEKLFEALALEESLEEQLADAKKAVKKAREELWAFDGVVPG